MNLQEVNISHIIHIRHIKYGLTKQKILSVSFVTYVAKKYFLRMMVS